MPTVHTYYPSRTYVGGLVSGIEPIDRGVVPAVSEQDTHVGAASRGRDGRGCRVRG